jgi:hypothetical protein
VNTIRNKDIGVTGHTVDGFTLSYTTDKGHRYRWRHIGYSVSEAKARFKAYIYEEEGRVYGNEGRNKVLLGALRCICGGSLAAARELLGNS